MARWSPVAIPRPTAAQLIRMMSVSTGEPIPDAYGPMMADRFDAFTGFASTPVKHGVPQGFSVLIVGAGMSGIAAAVKLKEAGVPFIIVEKGDDVGGVWRQNRYPACGVDTPSHLYSYTFAQGDWEHYFGKKPEIDGYFRDVAVNFGIFDDIQFNTEVVAARYDEAAQRWVTDLRHADGTTDRIESNVLVSAVGVFGVPRLPNIPGIERFQGQLLHTGQWDESAELTGKRVAVIGNGASAMQLAPAIVDDVEHMTVFQRSKQWAAPFPKFKKRIPDPIRFLLSEVPLYEWWYRLRLAWIFDSKVYESLEGRSRVGGPAAIAQCDQRGTSAVLREVHPSATGRSTGSCAACHSGLPALRQADVARQRLVPDADTSRRRSRRCPHRTDR